MSQQNSFATENTPIENEKTIEIASNVGAVGIVGLTCKMSPLSPFGTITSAVRAMNFAANYLIDNTSSEDTFVAENYFYAQKWYNNLSEKYPAANLDKQIFLKNVDGNSQDRGWNTFGNRIFGKFQDIEKINILYEKKITGQQLSSGEEFFLNNCEWAILHEAGHIKYNDLKNGCMVSTAILCGVESCYQLSKNSIYTPSIMQSLPKRCGVAVGLWLAMSLAYGITENIYSRYRKARADKFANQQADHNVLLAHIALFKNQDKEFFKKSFFGENQQYRKMSWLVASHPSFQSRIQATQDEIAFRCKK